jgi:hypothetical protein
MRVLRIGGEYLARRERVLWQKLAVIIAVGVAVVAVPLMAGYRLAALALPLPVLLAAPLLANVDRIRKGRLGERLVTGLLQQLPDDYLLVNDVMLGGAAGNLDHVLIGPCGVVVIETKRWAGRIKCFGDAWYVNGRRRGSVSRQANGSAAALRRFIAERHPEVGDRFVESVTVFANPRCRLEVNRARTVVVRYSELLSVVLEMARRRRMPADVAGQIAESLAVAQPFRWPPATRGPQSTVREKLAALQR